MDEPVQDEQALASLFMTNPTPPVTISPTDLASLQATLQGVQDALAELEVVEARIALQLEFADVCLVMQGDTGTWLVELAPALEQTEPALDGPTIELAGGTVHLPAGAQRVDRSAAFGSEPTQVVDVRQLPHG